MLRGVLPPVRLQLAAVFANVSGTLIRLRQLEALHQSRPLTASLEIGSEVDFWSLFGAPATYAPVLSHSLRSASASLAGGWSAAGSEAAATSQLMPMTGMISREQATAAEQP